MSFRQVCVSYPGWHAGHYCIDEGAGRVGWGDLRCSRTRTYLLRRTQVRPPSHFRSRANEPEEVEKPAAAADTQPEPSADVSQKYPPSFSAIVELIATGQEEKIPGVRDIPLVINEDKPSTTTMPQRKKPWEAA